MKSWIIFVIVITSLLLIGCEDSTTVSEGDIWFELKADTLNGIAPLTVNFTGRLHGDIRNLKLACPKPVLCIAYQKPCIIFCQPDSIYSAERTYNVEKTYDSSGQYWVFMRLQAVDEVIGSDTLLVSVQE